MVILFRCSAEAKKALDDAMERGGHADYSDVINAALISYGVLNTALDTRGSIVLSEASHSDQASPVKRRGRRDHPEVAAEPASTSPPPASLDVPALFTGTTLPKEPPAPLANPPSDVFFPGQPVPVDRWFFGQYSKLLPVKVSVRAMANLLGQHSGGFPIDKIAPQVAQEATLLGQYLEAHDQRHGLNRDDALATGFPSSGENADKSRLRYANQYVATMNKQGLLAGLLADLKLVNITSERTRRIQLTRTGWSLAVMPNPILDGQASAPNDRLSTDERAFLLDHIVRSVPVEDYAFRTILTAVAKGLNTPDALDNLLKSLPASKSEGISDLFITTQRSGLISRMADLGLLGRVRDGVRVSYALTETGITYPNRSVAA